MKHSRDIVRASLSNLRTPDTEDGPAIWELIRRCDPLDENSMYCNLLQCDHFADTCVVAETDGEIEGWVSAYVMPNDPETLFVWQVAVDEKARGKGLGILMLQHILGRDICKDVTRLQTTITSDNAASWALFRKFARIQGSSLSAEAYFKQSAHFDGRHDTEHMVTIKLANGMARAA